MLVETFLWAGRSNVTGFGSRGSAQLPGFDLQSLQDIKKFRVSFFVTVSSSQSDLPLQDREPHSPNDSNLRVMRATALRLGVDRVVVRGITARDTATMRGQQDSGCFLAGLDLPLVGVPAAPLVRQAAVVDFQVADNITLLLKIYIRLVSYPRYANS